MKAKPVKLEYDADVDAAYSRLRAGKIVESQEVQPGLIIDFGADEQIIGVEILRFAKRFQPKARKPITAAKVRRAEI